MTITLLDGSEYIPRKTYAERLADKYRYGLVDKINAGWNLTPAAELMRRIQPAKEDELTANYLNRNFFDLTVDGKLDDTEWHDNKRDIVFGFISDLNESRSSIGERNLTDQEQLYLLQADSHQDFMNRKRSVDASSHAWSVFHSSPASVLGFNVAFSLVEPWNLVGMPIRLVNAASKIRTFGKFAAAGAALTTAEETILHSGDPNRTIGMSLVNAGFASLLFGTLGAFASKSAKLKGEQIDLIKKHLIGIDAEGNAVVDLSQGTLDGARKVFDKRLDLNTATIEELLTLSGVGPSTAALIHKIRDGLGGRFNSIEDLLSSDLTKAELSRVKKLLIDHEEKVRVSSKLTAEGADLSPEEALKVIGPKALLRLAALSAPLQRLLNSKSTDMRRAAMELLESNFDTTSTVVDEAMPIALESLIGQKRLVFNTYIQEMESIFFSIANANKKAGEVASGRAGRHFRQLGQLASNLVHARTQQLRQGGYAEAWDA